MTDTPTELKACPFCGGSPFWQSEHDPDGFGLFWAIRCGGCGCGTQQHYVSNGNDCPEFRAEVRDAWNRRPAGAAGLTDSQINAIARDAGLPMSWLDEGKASAWRELLTFARAIERAVSAPQGADEREGTAGVRVEGENDASPR